MKKLIIITILILAYPLSSFADSAYFIDYTKILNTSKLGAAAQKELKEKIKKEESEIISQKQALTAEEYKKKVQELRKEVANLQKNKQSSFNSIAKSRDESRKKLQNAVNPIIKKYMEDNKIRIVLDKKGVILGDKTLEITDKIIAILNAK
jgi:Skp family chaperone for outer membrane proteins